MSMEVHPYAKLFPMLSPAEIREMAEDIRRHGQRHKIIVDTDGRLIDGRNRLEACRIAGKQPETEQFDGDDAEILDLVISLNINRRHLDASQRAMIAAEITTIVDGRPKKTTATAVVSPQVSVAQAAAVMGISSDSVSRARKVRTKGTPAVQRAVTSGEVSVRKAAEIADRPKAEQPAALAEAIATPRRVSGGTKFDPEELEAADRNAPPRRNGQPVTPTFDQRVIDKPLGELRRALDKFNEARPNTRLFNKAKYALNEFTNYIAEWRK